MRYARGRLCTHLRKHLVQLRTQAGVLCHQLLLPRLRLLDLTLQRPTVQHATDSVHLARTTQRPLRNGQRAADNVQRTTGTCLACSADLRRSASAFAADWSLLYAAFCSFISAATDVQHDNRDTTNAKPHRACCANGAWRMLLHGPICLLFAAVMLSSASDDVSLLPSVST